MNDIIENKTFDEIQIGDQASLTWALDRDGVEALGIITGNFNLIDLDPGPADSSMFGRPTVRCSGRVEDKPAGRRRCSHR